MGKPKPGKNMQFDPIEMIEKSAEMNRIDQTNPYGTSRYETDPRTGKTEFIREFSPELQGLHQKQMDIANKGTIKDPLANLGQVGGGSMGELMSSMFGRVKSRYMGTPGEADSRENNLGKGGNPQTPPPMSTSTQVRELQEQKKLAALMATQEENSGGSSHMGGGY